MSTDRYDEEANKIEFGTIAEQKDETDLDRRKAQTEEDDFDAGLINFPSDRLYGRQEELRLLKELCTHEAPQPEAPQPEAPLPEAPQPKSAKSGPQGFKSRAIFLGGISGAGKSALIKHTVEDLRRESKAFFFISGKYSISRTKAPFSAISEAMRRLIRDTVHLSSKEDLKSLRSRLLVQHLWEDSDDTRILTSAIVPSMPRLFRKSGANLADDNCSLSSAHSSTTTSIGYDINAIKYAFLSFVKSFPTDDCPLIFFLDDLQWADHASLALLTWILKDKTLENFIFIGAFRSNEVNSDEHPFSRLTREVKEFRGDALATHSLEISNLGPDDIAEFIADSLERSNEDVAELAEVVYSKTLGNIFFVKQALEELVRCDAIYYDIVFYQWQIRDISRVALEKFLIDDVVTMVKNKLCTLPIPLQKALSTAAFTRNSIDSETLLALLETEELVASMEDMHKLLQRAVRQGILLELHTVDHDEGATDLTYKFAHDRIQEAAMACVPEGEERDQLLERIAWVLLDLGSEEMNEWMLFAAVRHINKLPAEMVDAIDVAELNLRVGKLAFSKAAFSQAADLLREGSARLDRTVRWNADNHNLTLELLNMLLEAEHALGNEESAIAHASEVLENAKTLPEKCAANVLMIEAKAALYQRDYQKVIAEAVVVLGRNGIKVPEKPSSRHVLREILWLKWKQFFRPLHQLLASLPASTDPILDTRLKLVSISVFYAMTAKNYIFGFMLACRAMRMILSKRMITKDVPTIILYMALPYRKKENFESCFLFSRASNAVIDRFPHEPAKRFAKVNYIILAGFSMVRLPFMDGVSKLLALHKTLFTNGETEDSLLCAMFVPFAFLNASLPLNALLEPKLVELEELANSLHRKNFAFVFAMFRQVLYNLQGKSADPTSLRGAVFHEDEVLACLEGEVARLALFDLTVCRLMLATIFDDNTLMETMLDTIDPYPIFDPPLPRQHMRMSWVGLASATLANRRTTKHSKWSNTCFTHFQKLSSAGSPNGQVVAACLLALRKNVKAYFDVAIELSSEANNFCLVGLMNERCSDLFPEGSVLQHEYLKNAYWSYHDWDALEKVHQLEERHPFLRSMIRGHAPVQVNAIMHDAGMFGVGRPQQSSHSTVP